MRKILMSSLGIVIALLSAVLASWIFKDEQVSLSSTVLGQLKQLQSE